MLLLIPAALAQQWLPHSYQPAMGGDIILAPDQQITSGVIFERKIIAVDHDTWARTYEHPPYSGIWVYEEEVRASESHAVFYELNSGSTKSWDLEADLNGTKRYRHRIEAKIVPQDTIVEFTDTYYIKDENTQLALDDPNKELAHTVTIARPVSTEGPGGG